MEKYVGNWDQKKDVENDEKEYGMCDMCCDAGRRNIKICWFCTRSCTGIVHYHPIFLRYRLMA